MSRLKVYPLPEALGLDIRVKSGGGSMNNVERLMRVPLVDTPAARHIRAHEMTHAKYSPREPFAREGLPMHAVQRAEDMRMNVYGFRSGLDEALGFPTCEDESRIQAIVCKSPLAARTALCSTYRTGDWPRIYTAAEAYLPPDELDAAVKLCEQSYAFLDGLDAPSWDDALTVAAWFADDEPPPDEDEQADSSSGEGSGEPGEDEDEGEDEGEDPDPDPDPGPGPGEGEGEGEGPREDEQLVPVDLSSDPLDLQAEKELAADIGEPPPDAKAEAMERLTMERIEYRELEPMRKMPLKRTRVRDRVPNQRGMVPRHMHRYATDGAIFSERGRRRLRGGTILIDCSEQMAIGDDELEALLQAAPTSTIAAYRGCWVDRWGKLSVLAKDGKRTTRDEGFTNGFPMCSCTNCADIPVLEWLATQDGPLVWVGGKDEDTWKNADSITLEQLTGAARIIVRAKIKRYGTFTDLLSAIRSGKLY